MAKLLAQTMKFDLDSIQYLMSQVTPQHSTLVEPSKLDRKAPKPHEVISIVYL
jgi:hypothetical protein